MIYAAAHSTATQATQCFHCGHAREMHAKFCGSCGTACHGKPAPDAGKAAGSDPLPERILVPNAYVPPSPAAGLASPYQEPDNGGGNPPEFSAPAMTEVLPAAYPGNPHRPMIPLNDRNVPAFAHVQASVTADKNAELRAEAAKVMVLLARERLFLYFHWLLFIGLNFMGCWLALKCYYEFIGDEMSKTMIACTPFFFINTIALCCLVPIKGTRLEIGCLKERAQYIKFKMEFGHLL